ncbi:uncharacterized protein LOC101864087 [Aplysia californica]|uniref:Uncharacterized protein LOC101864087 n=1 Tax=Aplysia californica TaxID=6500 RepID=A0ABM0K1N5_APLCA|nr:uncharacterized protein LOC101864087 [Aplysia californica]
MDRVRFISIHYYSVSILMTFTSMVGSSSCPPGYLPPDCSTRCPPGVYGPSCASVCSSSCVNRECDWLSGDCHKCRPGFRGRKCLSRCGPGYYGDGCGKRCSPRCLRNSCDPHTGYCNGCAPGYRGSKCEIVLLNVPTPGPFHREGGRSGGGAFGRNGRRGSPMDEKQYTVAYILLLSLAFLGPGIMIPLAVYFLKWKMKHMERAKTKNVSRKKTNPVYKNNQRTLPGHTFLSKARNGRLKPSINESEIFKSDNQKLTDRKRYLGPLEKNKVKAFFGATGLASSVQELDRPSKTSKGQDLEKGASQIVSSANDEGGDLMHNDVNVPKDEMLGSPTRYHFLTQQTSVTLETAQIFSRNLFLETRQDSSSDTSRGGGGVGGGDDGDGGGGDGGSEGSNSGGGSNNSGGSGSDVGGDDSSENEQDSDVNIETYNGDKISQHRFHPPIPDKESPNHTHISRWSDLDTAEVRHPQAEKKQKHRFGFRRLAQPFISLQYLTKRIFFRRATTTNVTEHVGCAESERPLGSLPDSKYLEPEGDPFDRVYKPTTRSIVSGTIPRAWSRARLTFLTSSLSPLLSLLSSQKQRWGAMDSTDAGCNRGGVLVSAVDQFEKSPGFLNNSVEANLHRQCEPLEIVQVHSSVSDPSGSGENSTMKISQRSSDEGRVNGIELAVLDDNSRTSKFKQLTSPQEQLLVEENETDRCRATDKSSNRQDTLGTPDTSHGSWSEKECFSQDQTSSNEAALRTELQENSGSRVYAKTRNLYLKENQLDAKTSSPKQVSDLTNSENSNEPFWKISDIGPIPVPLETGSEPEGVDIVNVDSAPDSLNPSFALGTSQLHLFTQKVKPRSLWRREHQYHREIPSIYQSDEEAKINEFSVLPEQILRPTFSDCTSTSPSQIYAETPACGSEYVHDTAEELRPKSGISGKAVSESRKILKTPNIQEQAHPYSSSRAHPTGVCNALPGGQILHLSENETRFKNAKTKTGHSSGFSRRTPESGTREARIRQRNSRRCSNVEGLEKTRKRLGVELSTDQLVQICELSESSFGQQRFLSSPITTHPPNVVCSGKWTWAFQKKPKLLDLHVSESTSTAALNKAVLIADRASSSTNMRFVSLHRKPKQLVSSPLKSSSPSTPGYSAGLSASGRSKMLSSSHTSKENDAKSDASMFWLDKKRGRTGRGSHRSKYLLRKSAMDHLLEGKSEREGQGQGGVSSVPDYCHLTQNITQVRLRQGIHRSYVESYDIRGKAQREKQKPPKHHKASSATVEMVHVASGTSDGGKVRLGTHHNCKKSGSTDLVIGKSEINDRLEIKKKPTPAPRRTINKLNKCQQVRTNHNEAGQLTLSLSQIQREELKNADPQIAEPLGGNAVSDTETRKGDGGIKFELENVSELPILSSRGNRPIPKRRKLGSRLPSAGAESRDELCGKKPAGINSDHKFKSRQNSNSSPVPPSNSPSQAEGCRTSSVPDVTCPEQIESERIKTPLSLPSASETFARKKRRSGATPKAPISSENEPFSVDLSSPPCSKSTKPSGRKESDLVFDPSPTSDMMPEGWENSSAKEVPKVQANRSGSVLQGPDLCKVASQMCESEAYRSDGYEKESHEQTENEIESSELIVCAEDVCQPNISEIDSHWSVVSDIESYPKATVFKIETRQRVASELQPGFQEICEVEVDQLISSCQYLSPERESLQANAGDIKMKQSVVCEPESSKPYKTEPLQTHVCPIDICESSVFATESHLSNISEIKLHKNDACEIDSRQFAWAETKERQPTLSALQTYHLNLCEAIPRQDEVCIHEVCKIRECHSALDEITLCPPLFCCKKLGTCQINDRPQFGIHQVELKDNKQSGVKCCQRPVDRPDSWQTDMSGLNFQSTTLGGPEMRQSTTSTSTFASCFPSECDLELCHPTLCESKSCQNDNCELEAEEHRPDKILNFDSFHGKGFGRGDQEHTPANDNKNGSKVGKSKPITESLVTPNKHYGTSHMSDLVRSESVLIPTLISQACETKSPPSGNPSLETVKSETKTISKALNERTISERRAENSVQPPTSEVSKCVPINCGHSQEYARVCIEYERDSACNYGKDSKGRCLNRVVTYPVPTLLKDTTELGICVGKVDTRSFIVDEDEKSPKTQHVAEEVDNTKGGVHVPLCVPISKVQSKDESNTTRTPTSVSLCDEPWSSNTTDLVTARTSPQENNDFPSVTNFHTQPVRDSSCSHTWEQVTGSLDSQTCPDKHFVGKSVNRFADTILNLKNKNTSKLEKNVSGENVSSLCADTFDARETETEKLKSGKSNETQGRLSSSISSYHTGKELSKKKGKHESKLASQVSGEELERSKHKQREAGLRSSKTGCHIAGKNKRGLTDDTGMMPKGDVSRPKNKTSKGLRFFIYQNSLPRSDGGHPGLSPQNSVLVSNSKGLTSLAKPATKLKSPKPTLSPSSNVVYRLNEVWLEKQKHAARLKRKRRNSSPRMKTQNYPVFSFQSKLNPVTREKSSCGRKPKRERKTDYNESTRYDSPAPAEKVSCSKCLSTSPSINKGKYYSPAASLNSKSSNTRPFRSPDRKARRDTKAGDSRSSTSVEVVSAESWGLVEVPLVKARVRGRSSTAEVDANPFASEQQELFEDVSMIEPNFEAIAYGSDTSHIADSERASCCIHHTSPFHQKGKRVLGSQRPVFKSLSSSSVSSDTVQFYDTFDSNSYL